MPTFVMTVRSKGPPTEVRADAINREAAIEQVVQAADPTTELEILDCKDLEELGETEEPVDPGAGEPEAEAAEGEEHHARKKRR